MNHHLPDGTWLSVSTSPNGTHAVEPSREQILAYHQPNPGDVTWNTITVLVEGTLVTFTEARAGELWSAQGVTADYCISMAGSSFAVDSLVRYTIQ